MSAACCVAPRGVSDCVCVCFYIYRQSNEKLKKDNGQYACVWAHLIIWLFATIDRANLIDGITDEYVYSRLAPNLAQSKSYWCCQSANSKSPKKKKFLEIFLETNQFNHSKWSNPPKYKISNRKKIYLMGRLLLFIRHSYHVSSFIRSCCACNVIRMVA